MVGRPSDACQLGTKAKIAGPEDFARALQTIDTAFRSVCGRGHYPLRF